MTTDSSTFLQELERLNTEFQSLEKINKQWPNEHTPIAVTKNLLETVRLCVSYGNPEILAEARKRLIEHLVKHSESLDILSDMSNDDVFANTYTNSGTGARKMNTHPTSHDQVNDKFVRIKYGQLIGKFDDAQIMTTPITAEGLKKWPRTQTLIVTINECLPNEGGGDRASSKAGDKRRTNGTQVVVRATNGTIFNDSVAKNALMAAARKIQNDASVEELVQESPVIPPNTANTYRVRYAFDKESYLDAVFGDVEADAKQPAKGKRKGDKSVEQAGKKKVVGFGITDLTKDDDSDSGDGFDKLLATLLGKTKTTTSTAAAATGAATVAGTTSGAATVTPAATGATTVAGTTSGPATMTPASYMPSFAFGTPVGYGLPGLVPQQLFPTAPPAGTGTAWCPLGSSCPNKDGSCHLNH